MKAKVLKDFIDKNTRHPYHDGDTYENEDKARMAFLHKAGYLSKVEIEATVEPEKETPAEPDKGNAAADTNDGGGAGGSCVNQYPGYCLDGVAGIGGKGGKGGKKDKAAGEEK